MKRVSFLLCFLLPLLLGCTAERNTLTLCSSFPLAGGGSDRAVSMSRAVQMAVDEYETVTFAGAEYNLRYVALDGSAAGGSGWNAAQEERNARAAIAEHDCIAYIGTYNSGAARISIPILNRAQMLMISPGNTAVGLTKPELGLGDEPWIYSPLGPTQRNYCRVIPADDIQAPAAARYAQEVLDVETIFVFHDTEIYGRGLADIFSASARSLGMTLVGNSPVGIGPKTVNISSFADTIADANPDLVYYGGVTHDEAGDYEGEIAQIVSALRRAGYEGYIMGADGIAENDFLDDANIGSDARLLATLVVLPPSQLNDAGQTWASQYRLAFDSEEPDAFAAPSYEATQVVIRALGAVQTPIDPAADDFLVQARPALLNVVKSTNNYDGILGEWSFDENCDTTLTTISINRAENGTFNYVDVIE